VSDLTALLKNLAPQLSEERWVFCVAHRVPEALTRAPLMTFREEEGLTLVLPEADAASLGLMASAVYRQITLGVYTDLDAVGLTAAVSSTLAEAGISCNVVAAFHHDHLFVPEKDAQRALELLNRLSIK
jgi:uncharacterized protein